MSHLKSTSVMNSSTKQGHGCNKHWNLECNLERKISFKTYIPQHEEKKQWISQLWVSMNNLVFKKPAPMFTCNYFFYNSLIGKQYCFHFYCCNKIL